jgi:intermembrane space import and assembly protein 40
MQNCFREYPEVYGSELEGDGADEDDDLPTESTPAADYSDSTPAAAYSDSTPATASSDTTPPPSRSATSTSESSSSRTKSRPETGNADQGKLSSEPSSIPKSNEGRRELDLVPNSYKPDSAVETERSATQIKNSESVSESESLVPKAAHDAGDANTARLERK